MDEAIRTILIRSNEMDACIEDELAGATFPSDDRAEVSLLMCNISHEHSYAIRILVGNDLPTAATALVRLQYESLVRAMWILFAAPDDQIPDLNKIISAEIEALIARDTPSIAKMIQAISEAGHVKASDELARFKQVNWFILNSIVHGGIRPLLLHRHGCSLADALNIVQSSNALSTMTAMFLAIMSEDKEIMQSMSAIQRPFQDCLPPLLEIA